MKRTLALVLALAVLLTLSACGKSEAVKNVEEMIDAIGTVNDEKASNIQEAVDAYQALSDDDKADVENYEVLQDASEKLEVIKATTIYELLCGTYDIVDALGADIQDVWARSISSKSDILDDPIAYIAHEVSLDSFSLQKGVMLAFAEIYSGDDLHETYASWTDEEWNTALSSSSTSTWSMMFSMVNPLADFCVVTIRDTYYLDGSMKTVESNLEAAKGLLKEIGNYYSDSDTYTILKDMYTEISAYYDYCVDTTGNFAQATDTINDFRSNVKSWQSQIDFIL